MEARIVHPTLTVSIEEPTTWHLNWTDILHADGIHEPVDYIVLYRNEPDAKFIQFEKGIKTTYLEMNDIKYDTVYEFLIYGRFNISNDSDQCWVKDDDEELMTFAITRPINNSVTAAPFIPIGMRVVPEESSPI